MLATRIRLKLGWFCQEQEMMGEMNEGGEGKGIQIEEETLEQGNLKWKETSTSTSTVYLSLPIKIYTNTSLLSCLFP